MDPNSWMSDFCPVRLIHQIGRKCLHFEKLDCAARLPLGTRLACSQFVPPTFKSVKRINGNWQHELRRSEHVTTRHIQTYKMAPDFIRHSGFFRNAF